MPPENGRRGEEGNCMKKLRLAILGQGRSGRDIHGKYLLTATDRFEVAYVVEPLENRRERAKREYEGCEVLTEYHQLFEREPVDFVVNATPSHLHVPITKDLLEHGFNVLCEKPFARTAAEVDDLIATAEAHGVMLGVFQQSRFAPYFEKVKEVIASGVLGELIQVNIEFNGYARRWDWQCCQCFNGGNLYNTGPHPVDQALNLLNDYDHMPEVFCKMGRVNTFGDAEDYLKLILTAPDQPLIDVEIISCDAYPSFTYNIKGSRGGLKGDMTKIVWKYFIESEAPEQHLIKEPLQSAEGLPLYCSESLNWHEGQWEAEDAGTFTYAVDRLYQTIYDHLTEGKELVVTPKQVRQQIAVMEEAHRQNPMSVFA